MTKDPLASQLRSHVKRLQRRTTDTRLYFGTVALLLSEDGLFDAVVRQPRRVPTRVCHNARRRHFDWWRNGRSVRRACATDVIIASIRHRRRHTPWRNRPWRHMILTEIGGNRIATINKKVIVVALKILIWLLDRSNTCDTNNWKNECAVTS